MVNEKVIAFTIYVIQHQSFIAQLELNGSSHILKQS